MTKKIEKINQEKDEGEWMSFKSASTKDGEGVVREMIAAKSILTRPNPKLPASTQVPWPYNLEVAYIREAWTHGNTMTDTTACKSTEDGDNAVTDFETKFEDQWKQRGSGSSSSSSQMTGPPNENKDPQPPENKKDERDKLVVSNIRRVHAMCDRAMRDWEAIITKSQRCPNTCGCKFETDLQEQVEALKKMDSLTMAIDMKYTTGSTLTDEDIKKAGSQTTDMVNGIKDGNRKCAAIKSWMKLPVMETLEQN